MSDKQRRQEHNLASRWRAEQSPQAIRLRRKPRPTAGRRKQKYRVEAEPKTVGTMLVAIANGSDDGCSWTATPG